MPHEDLGSLTDCYVTQENGKRALAVTGGGLALDVAVQNQFSPPVEYFLTQSLNDVTIVSPAGAKTKILELSPGHGVVIGNYIEIYSETPIGELILKRFVQLCVVDVNINTITVQPFIGSDLDPVNVLSAVRVTRAMNVDGSITPVRFSIGPPNGIKWDLTRTMIVMVTGSNPDDALYGDLPQLANGVFFGFENDFTQDYLVNIQANAGYRGTAYDVNYTTRSSGSGDFGVSVRKSFAGREHYGVTIRLEGPTNDEFVVYVNDSLLGLTEHGQKVMGHIVED